MGVSASVHKDAPAPARAGLSAEMAGSARLVLGTSRMTPRSGAGEVLDAFVRGGGTAIDTAHRYGHGQSELAVAEWLESASRADIVLIGKGGHPDDSWSARLSSDDVLKDAEESRERLGGVTFDYYLLHRDDPSRPVDEILGSLASLRDQGTAVRIGVSNWSPDRLSTAVEAGFPVDAVSNHFGLGVPAGPPSLPGLVSAFDNAVHGVLKNHRIPLLAWGAQSGGFFADAPSSHDIARACALSSQSLGRREILRSLARANDCDPTDILIRWLVTASPLVFPVVSTSSAERITRICAAADESGLDPVVSELVRRVDHLAGSDLLLPQEAPSW